jgi:chaperonin GroES
MKKKAKKSSAKISKIKKTSKSLGGPTAKLIRSSIGVVPLADRVIVEPLGKEKILSSGIIIPDTADKERPDQGVIVAIGPGKRNETGHLWPVNVKVGDKVIFSKYGPDEIKIGDKEYYVIAESNILAIIN